MLFLDGEDTALNKGQNCFRDSPQHLNNKNK